jgi:hypothetical protein
VQPQFNETLISVGLVLKKFNKTSSTSTATPTPPGSDSYNLELSQRRAVSVATVLANQGVDQRRFYIDRPGESRSDRLELHEAGRAQNRRVEIAAASSSSLPPTACRSSCSLSLYRRCSPGPSPSGCTP